MPIANSNGIDIYYEIQGTGQPLLLINGLGYDLWMWHRMVPLLAEHVQVITFDNRGTGQSEKPKGPYNAQMLANDAAGLLEEIGVERAAVMGMSMGGFVAQALVLSRPELVGQLILAATSFGGPNAIPPAPEALALLLDTELSAVERTRRGIGVSCAPGFGEANAQFVQEWLEYRLENPVLPEYYQAQLAVGLGLATEEASFEHKLKAVTAPTLLLFGEEDKLVPAGNADLLARAIPNSTIQILTGAGHMFPLEVPAAAADAVVAFLGS